MRLVSRLYFLGFNTLGFDRIYSVHCGVFLLFSHPFFLGKCGRRIFLHGKAITRKHLQGCTKNLNQDKRWIGLQNLEMDHLTKLYPHQWKWKDGCAAFELLQHRNILPETDFLPIQTEPFTSHQKNKKNCHLILTSPLVYTDPMSPVMTNMDFIIINIIYKNIFKIIYFFSNIWKIIGLLASGSTSRLRHVHKTHSADHQELIFGVGHDVLATSARREESAWGRA